MRIVGIRERSVDISRYSDPSVPPGGLTTSVVAILTDVVREGRPVVGLGFSSMGRYAQGGLIGERFAPRLRAAVPSSLLDEAGDLDPERAWAVMMRGEKPGGHGERCVAVGTLDMALWDAAAKIAGVPLYRYLSARLGGSVQDRPRIQAYASGGYPYPADDLARLDAEIRAIVDLGFTHAKIKLGAALLGEDRRRIDTAATALGDPRRLAVDAMNAYSADAAALSIAELAPLDLWWFEDVCDPLDFPLQASIASSYRGSIGAGEALFSLAEARLLHLFGGLRPDRDVLLFDPVHCYGLTEYLRIVGHLTASGWPMRAFWPHGGHLFAVHVVAALGLGGAELNPFSFAPFGGLHDGATVENGWIEPPRGPGVGFEGKQALYEAYRVALELD